MAATATFTTVRLITPARPLCDPRAARGKHRAPRRLALLAWSQQARGAFWLASMSAGAVIAAVIS